MPTAYGTFRLSAYYYISVHLAGIAADSFIGRAFALRFHSRLVTRLNVYIMTDYNTRVAYDIRIPILLNSLYEGFAISLHFIHLFEKGINHAINYKNNINLEK